MTSSPMYDLPVHVPIGVDAHGRGPVAEDDPRYERTECWCSQVGCELWRDA